MLYFYAIWAFVLVVLGLAIYIAITRLPGFTKKRDYSSIKDEPQHFHLKLKPDYEISKELGAGHHEKFEHKFERYENKLEGYEIPWGYGDNKIVLMTKDPHWLFTYWELTDERKDRIKAEYGDEIFANSYPVLRVLDKTEGHSKISTDMIINDYARSWYINVEANRSYQVILGRKTHQDRFITLLESNVVLTPRAAMSGQIDENWPPIPGMEKYYGQFSFNEVLSSDSLRKD